MTPKYVYPIALIFSAHGEVHTNFYLSKEEAAEAIKESHATSIQVKHLTPGTEFCTDFDTDGNSYIRDLVEVVPGISFSMDFFVRNTLLNDPNMIQWFRATYDKNPETKQQYLRTLVILVNGSEVNIGDVDMVPILPAVCFDMKPEEILKRYIREFIHLHFNVEEWVKKE